jgi:hypothetical protein
VSGGALCSGEVGLQALEEVEGGEGDGRVKPRVVQCVRDEMVICQRS